MRRWMFDLIDTLSFSRYIIRKNPILRGDLFEKTMPRTLFHMSALVTCLALCLIFVYTIPLFKDASYNLSLNWEGAAMPENWQYNQKGWTVFTQEAEQKTLLAADGFSGFTGLQKLGQTFYFSRTLTEALDNPTLRLDTANCSMAVFWDGELLYTDHRLGRKAGAGSHPCHLALFCSAILRVLL